ncbi:MAG: alpha/beta hydrolase [bacterium]
MKHILGKCWLFFAILSCSSVTAMADTIELEVLPDTIASADYRQGDQDKPLLIYLHGFLQTRNFSTVKRLSDATHESGYSVLSPNLSLGISHRVKSLPCESIQLHSLESEAEEIDQWIRWATQRGHHDIVLIGHSSGSANIGVYLATKEHVSVKKTILISLTYFGPDRPAAYQTAADAQRARQAIANGNDDLQTFALAYCKNYLTTPKNYLSYYDWNDQKALAALNQSVVQNHVIVGGSDDRVDADWLEALEKTPSSVTVIEGANHFFDTAHEFDLLDSVENILAN